MARRLDAVSARLALTAEWLGPFDVDERAIGIGVRATTEAILGGLTR